MHEWALAESVVETVKKHAAQHSSARVVSVTLLFGELQKIDPDIFLSGLEMLLQEEAFRTDVFHLETEEAAFRCRACETEFRFADLPEIDEEEKEAIHFLPELAHTYMRCPGCGSPDFEVARGRGVTVKEILLETND